MGQRNIRLVLAYDGTNFLGWQRQKEGRTVQQAVEEALLRMHGHTVHIHAAGRTDSGVHASGQCINFITDIDSIQPERFAVALNSYLPEDVKVLRSDQVGPDFHSRYNAVMREYRYYIHVSPVPVPHFRLYSLRVLQPLDLKLLNGYARTIVGTHDFTSFTAPNDPSPNRIRLMESAAFFPEGPYLVFRITGNAFLWKMVRCLVGTMVELAKDLQPTERMREILQARDRGAAGNTAVAKGLFLHKVAYDE